MPSTIDINSLLTKYNIELQSFSSKESIFFRFIINSKSNYDETVFVKAIKALEIDEYISDLFDYLIINRLQLSFENIELFLDNRKPLQLIQLKEDFANKEYKSFGNFLMFFYKKVLGDPEIVSFKSNVADELNYKQYLLTPKISYIESSAYKNYSQAKGDYWELVEEYALNKGFSYVDLTDLNVYGMLFTSEFNNNFTKRIIAILLNRKFDNKINGSTLLIEADSSKSNFPVSLLTNIDIKRVLTGDYKSMHADYFLNSLEKMYEELLDYKLENDIKWDEGNFLESFLIEKMSNLNLEILTIDVLKEIKFYKFLLVKFLKSDSLFFEIFDKETNFTLELDNLKLLFNELKDYLKQKGYFE
jgi:hypothetical protein